MKLEITPVLNVPRVKAVLTITATNKNERQQLQAFAKELQTNGVRNTRFDTEVNKETEYVKLVITDSMRG